MIRKKRKEKNIHKLIFFLFCSMTKKKKILNVNLSTVTIIIIIIIILYNLSSLIDMKMKRLHLRFDLSV